MSDPFKDFLNSSEFGNSDIAPTPEDYAKATFFVMSHTTKVGDLLTNAQLAKEIALIALYTSGLFGITPEKFFSSADFYCLLFTLGYIRGKEDGNNKQADE